MGCAAPISRPINDPSSFVRGLKPPASEMDSASNGASVVIDPSPRDSKGHKYHGNSLVTEPEPKSGSCQVTTLFFPGQSKGPARAVPGEEKETR